MAAAPAATVGVRTPRGSARRDEGRCAIRHLRANHQRAGGRLLTGPCLQFSKRAQRIETLIGSIQVPNDRSANKHRATRVSLEAMRVDTPSREPVKGGNRCTNASGLLRALLLRW